MPASSPLEAVTARFPEAILGAHSWRGDATLVARREHLVAVARFLKEEEGLAMDFLMDLSVVDWATFGERPAPAFFASSGVAVRAPQAIPDEEPWPGPPAGCRFTLVYHFFSRAHRHRLRLVVPLDEDDPEVDSLAALWPGANWLEREAWDMFGVVFRGHPDPRRILMYDGFDGHPLRKDYPVNRRQPLIGPVN